MNQVGTARDKHKLAYIEVVVSRNGCINSEKIQRFYHVCALCDWAHCWLCQEEHVHMR